MSTTPASPEPSLVDLQVQLTVAREEFMASVTDLKSQVTPGALTARAGRAVLGWFRNDDGGIRPERVAIAGAVVAGIVLINVIGARRR